jgi:hypothetical protein
LRISTAAIVTVINVDLPQHGRHFTQCRQRPAQPAYAPFRPLRIRGRDEAIRQKDEPLGSHHRANGHPNSFPPAPRRHFLGKPGGK